MVREDLNDLHAFMVVANEANFTRAAGRLAVSQSALSRTIRALERRMDLLLLNRTTRSVSLTDAGRRLLDALSPKFEEIDAELQALSDLRDRPAGTVRITATDYSANVYIWPRLKELLRTYPEIKIELVDEYRLSNVVAERFDLGVRLGDQVEKDLIAVRIAPDLTMAIVGSPSYLARRAAPSVPRELLDHECINLRLPARDTFLAWELRKGRRELQMRVTGQVAFTNTYPMVRAALDGFGLAYVPKDLVQSDVEHGRLKWVLEDWYPTFTGFHVYYPSRRKASVAVRLVIDAIKEKVPRSRRPTRSAK